MSALKRLFKRLVAWPWLWRLLTGRRWRDQVIVLMYHKVVADGASDVELNLSHFRLQLDWLQRTCDILTPEQFVALDRSCSLHGRPKVLLTFDDAFVSVRDQVYPELKRRGLRGLVFVPSEPVIEGGTIWPQDVSDLIMQGRFQSLPAIDAGGAEEMLAGPQQRRAFERRIRQYLKTLSHPQRQQALAQLRQAAGWDNTQLQANSRIMSWDDLRACADVFSYGGHTHSHPIMSSQDGATQRLEVQTCADHIQRELGVAPLLFAYPNGAPGDYNADSIAALREAGYQWAFTTEEGIYRLQDDPMTIRRLPTWAPAPGDLAWLVLTAA